MLITDYIRPGWEGKPNLGMLLFSVDSGRDSSGRRAAEPPLTFGNAGSAAQLVNAQQEQKAKQGTDGSLLSAVCCDRSAHCRRCPPRWKGGGAGVTSGARSNRFDAFDHQLSLVSLASSLLYDVASEATADKKQNSEFSFATNVAN